MQSNQNNSPQVDTHVPDSAELESLAVKLGMVLHERNLCCATAESCTGGLVAKLITDVAGSSAWFQGGYVCYANACKHSMLGVPLATIEQFGAVSNEVVRALCEGGIARSNADIVVAISGVAGPGGGSEAKPVGTVCIGWIQRGAAASCCVYQFAGDREAIRAAAAGQALRGILTIVEKLSV